MGVLKMVKHVNAAPELVFTVATERESVASFIRNRGVERIDPLAWGAMRVGSKIRATRRMFGRETTEEFEVTAFDRPHRFVMQANLCGAALFTCEHRFIPDIAGTLVELTVTTEPVGLMARLMRPLSALMMGPVKRSLDVDLDELKSVAEQRASADWKVNPDAALRGYSSTMV